MDDAEQRQIMNALLERTTDRRMNELIDLLDPRTDKVGDPKHYLNMDFRALADIGHRKARWKDDQETALEQVEAHSRALVIALNKLVYPYSITRTVDLTNNLNNLATHSAKALKTGSLLDTRPWVDSQVVALLEFYIDWSVARPEKKPKGKCYNFLFECMKTLTGEYPKEDGPGGLRGAYSRLLPQAFYNRDHRFDGFGG